MFLLLRLLILPFRAGWLAGRLTAWFSFRAGRAVGLRRLLLLGVGTLIGLSFAPATGARTRARLTAVVRRQQAVPDGDLGEKVRFQLSHGPSTWHLSQPEVQVTAGVVTLSGTAPHQTAKADLERAVASVPGVARVDNRVVLAGSVG
jgi:hypothetical protein